MKHRHHTTPGKVYTGLLYYFLLCSCMNTIYPSHHFAYSPTGANASFLKEKNQMRISGNVTTVDNDDHANGTNIGMQVKTAYAITDHFGIAAAFFTGKEKDKYNQHSIYDDEAKSLSYRHKLGEISAGYFSSVNTRKTLFLELYAGYGLGRNIIKESYRQPYYGGGFYSNNYDLFFLQPGIALHHKIFFR